MPNLNNVDTKQAAGAHNGLLGDTPQKAYVTKLDLFNRFAEPELREVIAGLDLSPTSRVLDAGCGTGLITSWLAEQVPAGLALGVDLSTGHLRHAKNRLMSPSATSLQFFQADITHLPLTMGPFDLIWSSNAINHLRRPIDGLKRLADNLRPGGRLVLGQSAFLPDMFFAWDARLEKEVMLACRRYYRDKYGLDERDTTATRNLFGWMRQAGFSNVTAKTIVIERTAPLTEADQHYFVEGVFKGYWAHRVQPYLSEADWHTLEALCNPNSPEFCLQRSDFHHVQTFSIIIGWTR